MTHPPFELFVITSTHDSGEADTGGLPVAGAESVCANCGNEVGPDTSGKFFGYAICLSGDSDWFLCAPCYGPALKPRG